MVVTCSSVSLIIAMCVTTSGEESYAGLPAAEIVAGLIENKGIGRETAFCSVLTSEWSPDEAAQIVNASSLTARGKRICRLGHLGRWRISAGGIPMR